MKRLDDYQSVFFVGAGGIGMSALVRYCLSKHLFVAGYDRTPSDLTHHLQSEGAHLFFEDEPDCIPEECRCPDTTLVVRTPAVPETNRVLGYFADNGYEIVKRAYLLGLITHSLQALCFAGTHGETTTSSMAVHIFAVSGVGCNAFLGGISKNYKTNLLLSDKSEYVVIEADEFDRSFHSLTPFATVITATDSDHLDIYGTREAYLESFNKYTSLIRPDGYLIVKKGIDLSPRVQDGVKTYSYGINEGDFKAENIRIGNGEIIFDYISPLGNIKDIKLGVPVYVNIENGIAAMALAQIAGVSNEEIKNAMPTFGGVDRRFDFKIKEDNLVFLSDYAHHPAEIKQSISSIKALYPDKKVTAVFQPHLYTRTRDFYKEFAESLSLADEVILLDIYPARELPIEGVTSKLIYDNIVAGKTKSLCSKEELLDLLEKKNIEVLITLGAGDIDNMVPQIYNILKSK